MKGDGFPVMCLATGLVIAAITLATADGAKFAAGMGLSTSLFTAAGTAHQNRPDPPEPPS